jgi:type II secretory pathway pseudopilin PulG
MKFSERRKRRASGISLIEVMIATVILTTAVVGLSNVAVTTSALRAVRVEKAVAMHAIEQQLAAVEATDFATILATHNGRGFAVTLPGEVNAALHALPGDFDGLPGSIAVTAPTGDPDHLLEIRVRVDWQGRHGAQHLDRIVRLSNLLAAT